MKRVALPALIITSALLLAACGTAGKSIDDVTSCLKDAKLTTQNAKDNDKDVKEGVFGVSADLKNPKDTVIAVAAVAKTDKAVKDFKKDAKQQYDDLKDDEKKSVETGTEGRYVWVVAGNTKSETFKKSRDCVKP